MEQEDIFSMVIMVTVAIMALIAAFCYVNSGKNRESLPKYGKRDD